MARLGYSWLCWAARKRKRRGGPRARKGERSGPVAKRTERGRWATAWWNGGSEQLWWWAFGPKTKEGKEEFLILFLKHISKTNLNSNLNPLCNLDQNQTSQNNMQRHECTIMYLYLIVDFIFTKIIIFYLCMHTHMHN